MELSYSGVAIAGIDAKVVSIGRGRSKEGGGAGVGLCGSIGVARVLLYHAMSAPHSAPIR